MPSKAKPKQLSTKRSEGFFTASFNSLTTGNTKSERDPPTWFELATSSGSLEEHMIGNLETSSLCRPGVSYSQVLMCDDPSSNQMRAESAIFDVRRRQRAHRILQTEGNQNSNETVENSKLFSGPTSADDSFQMPSNSSRQSKPNMTLTTNDTRTSVYSSSSTSSLIPTTTSINSDEGRENGRPLLTYAEFVAKNFGLIDNVTKHRNEFFDVEDVSKRLGIGQWNFTDLESVMKGYPKQLNQFDDPHYTNLENRVIMEQLRRENC